MDAVNDAGLRSTPSEDPLDKHIIDFLLPKFQRQPLRRVTIRLLFDHLAEALRSSLCRVALTFLR